MQGGSTIAAIATARGESALSIVRISGPEAIPIASTVFEGADLMQRPSHTVVFGRMVSPDGVLLDEGVATVFRAPRSSTGEDVVEFTCHGGDAVPAAVLGSLLDAGAVAAGPGEFTRRSFLNGKMDLDQAEGVMDLIQARSVAAHRVSARQLHGRLKARLEHLRTQLLQTCGLVELELDFGEEDVEFAERESLRLLLEGIRAEISEMLKSSELTSKWREGLSVVLAGLPNAGKSTLLNALVGSDRVIVSSTPGTTRDFVVCEFELDGLLLKLVDTAGVRVSDDEIEAEGVRRTEALTGAADVVLYVFDITKGLIDAEMEFLSSQMGAGGVKNLVLVANKADLLTAGFEPVSGVSTARSESRVDPRLFHEDTVKLSPIGCVPVSAEQATSNPGELEALLEMVRAAIPPDLLNYENSDGMINERHRRHLQDAEFAVAAALELVASGSGGEYLSLELRGALDALGSITGEITNEDVLSEIFGRFCIGK